MMLCWLLALGLGAVSCSASSCEASEKKKIELTEEDVGAAIVMALGGATGLLVSHYMGGGDHYSANYRMSRRMRSASGATIGIIIGGVGYYVVNQSLKKRDERARKEALLDLDDFKAQLEESRQKNRQSRQGKAPKDGPGEGNHKVPAEFLGDGPPGFDLSEPAVRKECFDWQVRGRRLIQNHCVWQTEGRSFWVPSMEKKINLPLPNRKKE